MPRHIDLGPAMKRRFESQDTIDHVVERISTGAFGGALTNLVHAYFDFSLPRDMPEMARSGLAEDAGVEVVTRTSHQHHVLATRSLGPGHPAEKFVLSFDDVVALFDQGYVVDGEVLFMAIKERENVLSGAASDEDSSTLIAARAGYAKGVLDVRSLVLDDADGERRDILEAIFKGVDAGNDYEFTLRSTKIVGVMTTEQLKRCHTAFYLDADTEQTAEEIDHHDALVDQYNALPVDGMQRFWIGIEAWEEDYPDAAPFFYWVTGSGMDYRFKETMKDHPSAEAVKASHRELWDDKEYLILESFYKSNTMLTMLVDAGDAKAAWDKVVEHFPSARERFVEPRQTKTLDLLAKGGRFLNPAGETEATAPSA